jgi:hypothetical protein
MAINQGLRTPEDQLSTSRQQFIQSLKIKQQFTEECKILIPELERLWREKILVPLGYSNGIAFAPLSDIETIVINWQHYLHNYTPQLLSKAITRLSSRLKFDPVGKKAENDRGPVKNIAAYFKALVQDLRRKEQKRDRLQLKGEATDHIWLMEDRPGKIGIRLDCGDSGVVYVTYKQAEDLAEQLLTFVKAPALTPIISAKVSVGIPECQKCLDEEGSFTCIRPAHKTQ